MPEPTHDGFRSLAPAVVTLWRVGGLLAVAVPLLLGAASFGVTALAGGVDRIGAVIVLSIGLPLGAALLALAAIWPGLRYRHTSYRVDDRGLRIRRGVVVRTESSVPRIRVQHTDVTRGPLERAFDLATLVVYTAGTESSSVSLGGLPAADAEAIRDFLLDAGDGDDDDAV